MALIHSNLLIEDSIKAVKERLKTTLGNIKFQDGQVFCDDIAIQQKHARGGY